VRQSVPEAAASEHDGGLDTCCAATRSSVQCLGVGDVRRSRPNYGGNTADKRSQRVLPDWNNERCGAERKKKASTVSDMLNGIINVSRACLGVEQSRRQEDWAE
jgi:hypothetical protein